MTPPVSSKASLAYILYIEDCDDAYFTAITDIDVIQDVLSSKNGSKKMQSFGKMAQEKTEQLYKEADQLRNTCHSYAGKDRTSGKAKAVIEKMEDLKRKFVMEMGAFESKNEENKEKKSVLIEMLDKHHPTFLIP